MGSFAESVAWAESVKDPNNGHTWTLLGNGYGGLSVGCIACHVWMTTQSLRYQCALPHDQMDPPRS